MQTFLGVLLGGGILTFIQFLITRHDNKHDRLAAIEAQLTDIKTEVKNDVGNVSSRVERLSEQMSQREAVLARTHILRFADELYNNVDHSKEYFDQTLEDIDTYESYCEAHKDFKNSRTVMAEQNIRETYDRLLKEHKFI